MSPALLVGGGLGALAIITAGVVTVLIATRPSTPEIPQLPKPQEVLVQVKVNPGAQAEVLKNTEQLVANAPAQGPAVPPGRDLTKVQPADLPKEPAPESARQPIKEEPKPPPQPPPPPSKEPMKEPAKESAPPVKKENTPPVKVAGPGGQLDRETLQKIKEATLYLRVTGPDGSVSQGSGFFGLAPGLVLTNAHVLGMLSPDSRRPARVEIVYRSGLPGERTFQGEILGVDRSSDLAVLRVTGDALPTPLDVRSAKDLTETQTVYIVGYPFGDALGKNVTISTSSVSSLRTDAFGTLRQVQVNGGMHPGNSGGPVVNSSGEVVGVAVSGIRATQINFAVPGDFVHVVVDGRVVGVGLGQAYRAGDRVKLPVRVELLDPLGKATKPAIHVWTGDPGKPRGPSPTAPAALPGDSPVLTVELPYDGKGMARGEIELPPLPPGKVYWHRPSYFNGAGKQFWVSASVFRPTPPVDREPASLVLRHESGQRTIDMDSNATFRLIPPSGKERAFVMNMKTKMGERTQAGAPQGDAVVLLTYQKYNVGISIDGKGPPASARMKRIVSNIGNLSAQLVIDGQGNIKANRADARRVPRDAQEDLLELHGQISDSLEAIALPVPNRLMQPNQKWQSVRRLPILVGSGVEKAVLALTYTYEGTLVLDGRKAALIAIVGQVRGGEGHELRVGGRATGRAAFDLERGQVLTANLTLVVDLNVSVEEQSLRATGTLETRLTRDFSAPVDLSKAREVVRLNGVLAAQDPNDRVQQKSHHKVHMVPMTAGRTYVIDMVDVGNPPAAKFDPFLRLEDPGGMEVAHDDDSGGGLNARIVYLATQTGSYRIICTTFQPGQTGRYLLVVREAGP
jgi:S1-C subfamily serine protease